jgi:hypothetical protein
MNCPNEAIRNPDTIATTNLIFMLYPHSHITTTLPNQTYISTNPTRIQQEFAVNLDSPTHSNNITPVPQHNPRIFTSET